MPVDLSLPLAFPKRRLKSKYAHGWRLAAVAWALAATAVFFINLIMTIVCFTFDGEKKGTLYVGDCESVDRIDTWLHLLINVLSTILLSASNYCMQCVSAPTRKDIDKVHAKGKWLDIGILSIRNLRSIGTKRVVLWILLGASSLPLHLFYNSAVFKSIANFQYQVAAVGQSFVDDPDCEGCPNVSLNRYYLEPSSEKEVGNKVQSLHKQARAGQLDMLENLECINQYGKRIQSFRGSLLLVVQNKDFPPKESVSLYEQSPAFLIGFGPSNDEDPYSWMCLDDLHHNNESPCPQRLPNIKQSAENWTFEICLHHRACDKGFKKIPVHYCLSERMDPKCEIRWSMPISLTVILLNLLKAVLVFYTVFGIHEEPLMAIGDAITSFLERPDQTTRGMCLESKNNVKSLLDSFDNGPRRWHQERYSWRHASSRDRLASTFFLILIILVIGASLVAMGLKSFKGDDMKSLASIARVGFGALDTRAMVNVQIDSVLGNTLLANLPQVIISIVYFSYNSLFTCMLLGYEWATYSSQRKGLRVTTKPRKAQRSTYFLSLPYRFSLPLAASSALLHWLVSQSIFFVAIDTYRSDLTLQETGSKLGYSPIAMISGLIVGIVMLLFLIGFGFIRHPVGINMAGSCSAVISAACHPLPSNEGKDLAYKKLKWGVVGTRSDGIGHCSFSDGPVEKLKKGEWYAGY